jgi:DNA-binding response OmpR family regulator
MLTTNLKHRAAGQRYYGDKMRSDDERTVQTRIADLARIDSKVKSDDRKLTITQCEARLLSYMTSTAAAALERQQIAATVKAVSA